MAAIDALRLGVEAFIAELPADELRQLLAVTRPDCAALLEVSR